MKFVYKPFQLIAHSLATKLGKTAFHSVWARVGEGEQPPNPKAGPVSLPRVAAAAALEAATMAAVGAAIDQLTARSFHHLIGAWPEKPPEPESES